MAGTVTIGEAADLLGVHRNTVRNRIKAGHYNAHKVVTPQGETYAIDVDSLGVDPTNGPHNPSQSQVHHNASNPSQARALAGDDPQTQQLAIVQQLLAPFIAELGETKIELGRLQERVATIERERDELAAELELLREIAHRPTDQPETRTEPYTASPTAPGATEAAAMAPDTLHRPSIVVSAWRRLRGRV